MRLTPKTPTMLDKRVSLISNLDMCSELHLPYVDFSPFSR